ncbi:MAG TPA: ArsC/Spx/MgsR family protein [Eudoraea sp.]|nr:ArsC/Spx/MgsR family protein [Eudoraea sp.]
MKKIYHLSTCSTCQRILKGLSPLSDFHLQDIKTQPITPGQLEEMKQLAGNYETLFSRRAMLYKTRNLGEKQLVEADYKNLILDHYTFLKRPVILIDGAIFIGNSRKVVESAKQAIHP